MRSGSHPSPNELHGGHRGHRVRLEPSRGGGGRQRGARRGWVQQGTKIEGVCHVQESRGSGRGTNQCFRGSARSSRGCCDCRHHFTSTQPPHVPFFTRYTPPSLFRNSMGDNPRFISPLWHQSWVTPSRGHRGSRIPPLASSPSSSRRWDFQIDGTGPQPFPVPAQPHPAPQRLGPPWGVRSLPLGLVVGKTGTPGITPALPAFTHIFGSTAVPRGLQPSLTVSCASQVFREAASQFSQSMESGGGSG